MPELSSKSEKPLIPAVAEFISALFLIFCKFKICPLAIVKPFLLSPVMVNVFPSTSPMVNSLFVPTN